MPTTPSKAEATATIAKTGDWHTPQGVVIPVRIIKTRRAYGRVEVRITPLNGEGEAWVQEAYITRHAKPLKLNLAALPSTSDGSPAYSTAPTVTIQPP